MTGYERLPFADHLLSLLIVDLDALAGKARSLDEITRMPTPQPLSAGHVGKAAVCKLHRRHTALLRRVTTL